MVRPQDIFEKSMDRANRLLRLHKRLHGKRGRPAQEVSDILRGTLVMAVGALDALVLSTVAEKIPGAARDGRLGKNVAAWVSKDPEAFLQLLAQDDPSEALANLAEEQLGQMTFQKSGAIEGVLAGTLGCDLAWEQLAASLNSGKDPWDADRVRDELDEFVLRRHRIAHSADLRDDGKAARPIQWSYVDRACRLIAAVGDGVVSAAE